MVSAKIREKCRSDHVAVKIWDCCRNDARQSVVTFRPTPRSGERGYDHASCFGARGDLKLRFNNPLVGIH
jgi:hypothetical protein